MKIIDPFEGRTKLPKKKMNDPILDGAKKVRGRMKVLKALLYKSHMVYIRMIGDDYFEYLLEFNGEIYSSYIIMTPTKGKKKLNDNEIRECANLIYSGAEATLDTLLGQNDMDAVTKRAVEIFEANRSKVEGKDKKDATSI